MKWWVISIRSRSQKETSQVTSRKRSKTATNRYIYIYIYIHVYILLESLGSSLILNSVGIDGPKMSASRIPLLSPWRANDSARLAAIVDLPTPPFADDTAMILRTPGMLRFWGRPRCMRGSFGGAFERGSPWK